MRENVREQMWLTTDVTEAAVIFIFKMADYVLIHAFMIGKFFGTIFAFFVNANF